MPHKLGSVAPSGNNLASSIQDQARASSVLSGDVDDDDEHYNAPRIPKGEIDEGDFQNFAVHTLGLDDHQVAELLIEQPPVKTPSAFKNTTLVSRGLLLLVANAFIIILIVSLCVMFVFKEKKVSIDESCLSNSDCNSYVGLKCTMGTCLCGTVEYWDGLQCAPQRTYNRSCTSQSQCNSLAYLICMNVTSGLYTDSICSCSGFRYWTGAQCSNLKSFNDICTSDGECDINNYLTCINGRCDCNSTQFWNNEYCENKRSYGSQCFSTYWCNNASSGLACSTWDPTTGTCDCLSNQYWWSTTKTCLNQLPINSTCTFNYQCLTNLSLACSSTTTPSSCQCSGRYFYNSTKCTPKFLSGSPCTSSLQCDSTLLLTCNSTANVCTCNESRYIWDGTQCVIRRTIGGACTSDSQCLGYQNLTCPTTGIWNGTCACPTNHYWDATSSICVLKKLWNQTCSTSYECYDGGYLSCQPSTTINATVCDCGNYTLYWTGFLNNTYGGYCTPKVNYNVTSFTCVSNYQCRDYNYITCISGLCTCVYTKYWDGVLCEPRLNYSYPCNSTSMCRNWPSGPNLQCLVPTGGSIKQCVCSPSQYFDYCNDYCYTAKDWQQSCNTSSCYATSMCDQTKGLSCINGICNCTNTEWWNSTSCRPKGTNLGSCTTGENFQCQEYNLLSCIASQCQCGSNFYWSSGSNYCLLKQGYLGTCTATYECITAVGVNLSCQGGQCKCSIGAAWNSTLGNCV